MSEDSKVEITPAFLPTVVVNINGGAVYYAESNVAMRVIILDEDTEGSDQDRLAEIEGEEVYVHDFSIKATSSGGEKGINPARVTDVAAQVDLAFGVTYRPKEIKPRWFAVTGRIPGDDEDVCHVFKLDNPHPTDNREVLFELFDAEIYADEENPDEAREATQKAHGQTVFINSIVSSETPIVAE